LGESLAAELSAIGGDTSGFTLIQSTTPGDSYWVGTHREAQFWVIDQGPGGTIVGHVVARVPLDLVAQRAVVLRLPGDGRSDAGCPGAAPAQKSRRAIRGRSARAR
jgi:hypothetical protein